MLTWDDSAVFDDSVSFTSGQQTPVSATGGDTIVWNYDYGTCFKVFSGDLADLTVLRLFGHGDGSDGQVDVKFWLTDSEHKPIPTTVNTFNGRKWNVNTNLILYDSFPFTSGDDKLGDLKGATVADFHVEVKVNHGEVIFGGGRMEWEVDDLEVSSCPEPGSVIFLATGLTAFGYRLVRRTKGSDKRIRRVAC
jgi:hypothetical protein